MLTVKIEGLERALSVVGRAQEALEDALRDEGVHRRVAAILIADARRNIDEGGRPQKFAPLADATKLNRLRKQFRGKGGLLTKNKTRTRKGIVEAARSLKILRDTGNLYSQMNYDSSQGNTFFLGVVDYLKYHQSDAPRRKLPQRKVFQPIQTTFEDIESVVVDYLKRKFRGI